MTIVLKLKQGESGTELNLNASSAGFQLAGWSPVVASPVHMADPAPITETMNIRLAGSSQDNIAASMQAMHEMQILANRYMRDAAQIEPIWLHAKMFNETGERRALVRSINVQYRASWFGSAATALDVPLSLTIVRGAAWEAISARDMPFQTDTWGACVVYDYTQAGTAVGAHDIVGDIGARIRLLALQDGIGDPGYSDDRQKYWIGLRSANKHGADGITNFEHIWELEDGSNSTDVTDTADATASAGNKVRVSESAVNWDNQWNRVLYIQAAHATGGSNEDDCLGLFLWLLRAKVTSGTWEVEFRFSPSGLSDWGYIGHQVVEINDAQWYFKEMAIQTTASRDLHAHVAGDVTADSSGRMQLEIFARRTSGSGDLDLDCVVPLPIDEGFLKLDNPDCQEDTAKFHFAQSPEGEVDCYQQNIGDISQGKVAVDFTNFVLPPGDGRMYIVYESTGGSDISSSSTVRLNWLNDIGKYYERWLSLRGAE